MVHFKQFTDVQLVGGFGSLRGRVSDLFPPPSWRRAVSWMCDPPFSLPMRGGVPWRVLSSPPARGWLIAFLLCTCAGISLLRGGLLGGRACLLPGQSAAVLASPLRVAGAIPRGAARFGVYACQICTQRGSWSHLRRRLLLRPGTRAYAPPDEAGGGQHRTGSCNGGWWVVHLKGSASRVWEGGGGGRA